MHVQDNISTRQTSGFAPSTSRFDADVKNKNGPFGFGFVPRRSRNAAHPLPLTRSKPGPGLRLGGGEEGALLLMVGRVEEVEEREWQEDQEKQTHASRMQIISCSESSVVAKKAK